jgi:oligopeptide transport system permease protein
MLGTSIPAQVLALGFVYFLAYKLGWFPLTYDPKVGFKSMFLPVLALALSPMGIAARFTRNEMLEVLNSEYITLAETKGIPRGKIIAVHALKNALVPLITTLAPMVVALMTGSSVLENIFGIPGIGKLFINAIQSNDYNVVLSLAFIFSAMYISITLVVDILYGIIDPRISLTGGAKK